MKLEVTDPRVLSSFVKELSESERVESEERSRKLERRARRRSTCECSLCTTRDDGKVR